MQLPSALLGRSSKKKAFLIFLEMESCTFWAQAWRKKSTWENFLYSGKLLIISQKLFLHFGKWKPRKKFLIFQETELSYISGNGNPEKRSYISGEMELSSSRLKKYLIFQVELPKPPKSNFLILLQKKLWMNFSKNTFG